MRGHPLQRGAAGRVVGAARAEEPVISSWSGFDWSYDLYDEAGSIEL